MRSTAHGPRSLRQLGDGLARLANLDVSCCRNLVELDGLESTAASGAPRTGGSRGFFF
jgi:hypothetical protein